MPRLIAAFGLAVLVAWTIFGVMSHDPEKQKRDITARTVKNCPRSEWVVLLGNEPVLYCQQMAGSGDLPYRKFDENKDAGLVPR